MNRSSSRAGRALVAIIAVAAGLVAAGSSPASGAAVAVPASATSRAVAQVVSGSSHNCALLDDGTVHCWGNNTAGQLGIGSGAARGDTAGELPTPAVRLGAGRTAVALSAGSDFTCALLDDGRVRCWGANYVGQLGVGSTVNLGDDGGELPAPAVPLGAGRTATAISSGAGHTCALLDDGNVRCWGYGASGQLGTGSTANEGDGPGELPAPAVPLGSGRTAVAITSGWTHTCALLDDGTVHCWGSNANGQLGVGSTISKGDNPGELPTIAVPLGTGRTATAIDAGGSHTCAILDDGTVHCWGYNFHGQLGVGSIAQQGDAPGELPAPAVPLGAGRTAIAVHAGADHNCVVLDDRTTHCWGRNGFGQLGTGSTATLGDVPGELPAPAVPLGPGRSAISADGGLEHTCAVVDDGTVHCWGRNASGQLGIGSITTLGDGPGELPAPAVAVGFSTLHDRLASGASHTCALVDDGSVHCWGANAFGQLGIGSTVQRGDDPDELPTPAVPLGDGRTATAITAGNHHTCALLDDGAVRCWGANGNGELGVGSNAHLGDAAGELPAATVSLGAGRVAIGLAAGSSHTCALLDDGSVHCWGANAFGQLGVGSTSTLGDQPNELPAPAVLLGSGRTATAITAGEFHTCALLDDGTVHCWGYNVNGELGAGSTATLGDAPGELPALPVSLGAGRTATAITAGWHHACALVDDGTVRCWGYNFFGDLGIGSNDNRGDQVGDPPAAAVQVGAGRTVTAVTAGVDHTCAVLDDGTVQCWGRNNVGQLGMGHTDHMGDNPGELPGPAVPMGNGVAAVGLAAGADHTCAFGDDGAVRCWGYNAQGQLGVGSVMNLGDSPGELPASPVPTTGAATVAAIGVADARVQEADGRTRYLTFRLSRSNAVGAASVAFATSDRSARDDRDDYEPLAGRARFAPGAHEVVVRVAVFGDRRDEVDETVTLRLSAPAGARIADPVAVGTIVDDDPAPDLRVGDASITETTGGTATLRVQIGLSEISEKTVKVKYATAPGTATAPADYTAKSGTLTIAAGVRTAVVLVTIAGDAVVEDSETLYLVLSDPTNAGIDDGVGFLLIVDDD